MPTNEERRQVAARLREANKHGFYDDKTFVSKLELIIGTNPCGDHADLMTLYRLADLIEPEERTCRIEIDWDYDGGCPAYYRNYVCSECEEDFIYYKHSHINYCPNCGAKAVE